MCISFQQAPDIVGLNEMLVKSMVCMRKHSFPKAAGDGLMVGWRTDSGTDRGPCLALFSISINVCQQHKETHRLHLSEFQII